MRFKEGVVDEVLLLPELVVVVVVVVTGLGMRGLSFLPLNG
jgi:hypothetical protein